MPAYDYRCRGCGDVVEVVHGMTESPAVGCACGALMARMPSCPNIGRGRTLLGGRLKDRGTVRDHMREVLREDHGVHNVHASPGRTLDEVYNDVRDAGSFVKERMAQESERNAAKLAARRKERHRTAPQRIPGRVREVAERARRKKAEGRAVRVSG